MGKYLTLIAVCHEICHITLLILCFQLFSQGAIGKCTSLFNYFEGVMKKCVDSSSAISLAISNEVQSELAHLLSEDSRKRRANGHS